MNRTDFVNAEERKSLILAEARELFINEGYDQTSIRKIASRIQYSPASIYLYYRDKKAIFNDILDNGFSDLHNRFKEAHHSADPLDKLRTLLNAYLSFAIENRELYRLTSQNVADLSSISTRIFEEFKKVVDEGIKLKAIQRKNSDEVVYYIWSTVHGFALLLINDQVMLEESKIQSFKAKMVMSLISFLSRESILG